MYVCIYLFVFVCVYKRVYWNNNKLEVPVV